MRKSVSSISFLIIFLVFPIVSATDITIIVQEHELILVKDIPTEFRLSGNPTTGCVWWIASRPDGVLIAETGKVTGTLYCPTGSVGCGEEITVFLISSRAPGQYFVEFRFGHPWEKSEYYTVANLKLYVVNSDQRWITNVLYKDSNLFYFPSPCDVSSKFCVASTLPLNFEYSGLVDWANSHIGQLVTLRITDVFGIVVEARPAITTTATTTSTQQSITTGYGYHPENLPNLTELIDGLLKWLQCVFLRRC